MLDTTYSSNGYWNRDKGICCCVNIDNAAANYGRLFRLNSAIGAASSCSCLRHYCEGSVKSSIISSLLSLERHSGSIHLLLLVESKDYYYGRDYYDDID